MRLGGLYSLYFSEDERLLVVDRVDAVAGDDLRTELAPHRVRRQSEHVHLHVRPQLPVSQKLTGNDLSNQQQTRPVGFTHSVSSVRLQASKRNLTIAYC